MTSFTIPKFVKLAGSPVTEVSREIDRSLNTNRRGGDYHLHLREALRALALDLMDISEAKIFLENKSKAKECNKNLDKFNFQYNAVKRFKNWIEKSGARLYEAPESELIHFHNSNFSIRNAPVVSAQIRESYYDLHLFHYKDFELKQTAAEIGLHAISKYSQAYKTSNAQPAILNLGDCTSGTRKLYATVSSSKNAERGFICLSNSISTALSEDVV